MLHLLRSLVLMVEVGEVELDEGHAGVGLLQHHAVCVVEGPFEPHHQAFEVLGVSHLCLHEPPDLHPLPLGDGAFLAGKRRLLLGLHFDLHLLHRVVLLLDDHAGVHVEDQASDEDEDDHEETPWSSSFSWMPVQPSTQTEKGEESAAEVPQVLWVSGVAVAKPRHSRNGEEENEREHHADDDHQALHGFEQSRDQDLEEGRDESQHFQQIQRATCPQDSNDHPQVVI